MTTKIPPELVDDQVFGRRNRIINGDMRVAQRGTSFTGSEYTLDRFEQVLSGGSATTTQESFALGSEVEGFTKYLKQAVSAGNDYCGIIYRVEDVRSLPQGNVTISFYAKGTNPAGGSLQLVVHPMHDGSTVHSTLLDTTITLTSSWQRFIKTFTVPSFSGMATPTANSQFYIRLAQSSSDSGTAAWELNLTGVQLEVGSQATPFESKSIGEEEEQCRRYFQYHNFPDSAAVMNACMWASTSMYGTYHFYPKMRIEPTTTISAAATFDVLSPSSQTAHSPVDRYLQNHSNQSVEVYLYNASGLGDHGNGVWVRSDTSGGETATFTFDAEL